MGENFQVGYGSGFVFRGSNSDPVESDLTNLEDKILTKNRKNKKSIEGFFKKDFLGKVLILRVKRDTERKIDNVRDLE